MVDKRIETPEEYLNRNGFGTKKTKKRRKGLVAWIIVGALAVTAALASIVGIAKKSKKNNSLNNVKAKTIESTVKRTPSKNLDMTKSNILIKNSNDELEDDLTMELAKMGVKLDFPEESLSNQPKYGNVTSGNVNVESLVTVTDQKTGETIVYKDEKALKNADKVGEVVIDTKGDTLVVDNNGKVTEKTPGYEITNPKTGEVIKGEGNVPEGYVEDKPGEYIKIEDQANLVIIDKDIWGFDNNGPCIIFNKGEYVTKETYQRIQNALAASQLYTSRPNDNANIIESKVETSIEETYLNQTVQTEPVVVPSEPIIETEETMNVDAGVINPDGTYTIYGMIFETKADYDQWVIQGYEGYAEVDGIMMSDARREEYQKTLNR